MAIQRATENTVREAPMTGARLQSANFNAGEIYGKALEGFGRDLGKVAEAADTISLKYDTAAAKNADTEDAIELARIEAEARTKTGIDARTATEEAIEKGEEIQRRRLASLKGRSGMIYSDQFGQRLAGHTMRMNQHAIQQADVAMTGAAKANMEANVEIAVANRGDPEAFAANMANARREFDVANRGATKEMLDVGWKQTTSGVHMGIVGKILASPDIRNPERVVQEAQDWLNGHVDQMTGFDQGKAQAQINPLIRDVRAEADDARAQAGDAGAAVAGAPTGEAPPAPTGGNYEGAGGRPGTFVDPDAVDGVASVSAQPGKTPKGLDPNDPVGSAAGIKKPPVQKAGEPYKSEAALYDGILGKGNWRPTSTFHTKRGNKEHQATDLAAKAGTNIHPPLSGKVVDKGFDPIKADGTGGGGWYVLVQHDNGTTSGFAHMRGESTFKEGDRVEKDDVIGHVGSTGHSTGNHLHYTLRDTRSWTKVDPATKWTAMADSGGPPLIDPAPSAKRSWKEGELQLVTDAKDTLGQRIENVNRLAQKEGWSQSWYDTVIKKTQARAGLDDQMWKAGYDVLLDRVWTNIAAAEQAGGFTDIKTLGGDFARLEGRDQATIIDRAETNVRQASEGTKVPANGDQYVGYLTMAHSPFTLPGNTKTQQQIFMETDFRRDPNITPAESVRLTELKYQMIEDLNNKLAPDRGVIGTKVLTYFPVSPQYLKDPNNKTTKQYNQIVAEVAEVVGQRQRDVKGQKLNDEELDEIVASATTKVFRGSEEMPVALARAGAESKGWKPGTVRAHQDQIVASIPYRYRQRIIAQLQREGREVTNALVAQRWLDKSR